MVFCMVQSVNPPEMGNLLKDSKHFDFVQELRIKFLESFLVIPSHS